MSFTALPRASICEVLACHAVRAQGVIGSSLALGRELRLLPSIDSLDSELEYQFRTHDRSRKAINDLFAYPKTSKGKRVCRRVLHFSISERDCLNLNDNSRSVGLVSVFGFRPWHGPTRPSSGNGRRQLIESSISISENFRFMQFYNFKGGPSLEKRYARDGTWKKNVDDWQRDARDGTWKKNVDDWQRDARDGTWKKKVDDWQRDARDGT